MPQWSHANRSGYVETWGDPSGDPVLLLHGGFCSLEVLRPVGDLLAPQFAIHAPERAGHGRTPDSDGPYSYDDMVLETLAYLDSVGLDAVHVVGFSDGANVGYLMALRHPSRVRTLAAISGNVNTDAFVPEEEHAAGMPAEHHERVGREYAELSPDGAEHAEVVIGKLLDLWGREPALAFSELAAITAPTLVLVGEHDMIRRDHSQAIADAIPGSRFTVVPGTSHMLIVEEPAAVAAEVRELLP